MVHPNVANGVQLKNIFWVSTLLVLGACNRNIDRNAADQQGTSDQEVADADYDPEARIKELGISLSAPTVPIANYVNAVRVGNLLFLSGKGPQKPDGENISGKLGADLTIEEGYAAARLVGIRQLSTLKAELGDLKKVMRVVKVLGMVNAVPEFTDHPKVINGFSDLMVEVFGERGKHARAAVGMGSLPSNIAVEIELIVEIEE